jgi:hypothetical protein
MLEQLHVLLHAIKSAIEVKVSHSVVVFAVVAVESEINCAKQNGN